MTLMRAALLTFLGLGLLCIVHAIYFYPLLPKVVAAHFGAQGKPDAWSSRNVFVAVYLVAVFLNGVFFLGISYGIRCIPDSAINLPGRDFWLSLENRNQTYRFLFQYFLWLGSATYLLLFDIFHQAFMVHIGRAATLGHPWWSFGLYLLFALAWSIGLYKKFSRKDPEQGEPDQL